LEEILVHAKTIGDLKSTPIDYPISCERWMDWSNCRLTKWDIAISDKWIVE
jgi:hypothetical protein